MNLQYLKRRAKLICMLLLCLCLSGCWDLKEIDELAIINFIGMDINPDTKGSTFYYQVINATGIAAQKSSGINAPVYTYKVETEFTTEVPSRLLEVVPKVPFFDHSNAMIVTERAARKGIGDQLNFLEKQPDRESTISLLITDAPLSDLMETYTTLERMPGRNAHTIVKNEVNQTGKASGHSRIKDVVENLESTRINVVPIISLSSVSIPSTQRYENIDANKGNFYLNGGAIVKQGKMIGKLSTKEMPLYNMLNGQVQFLHPSLPIDDGHISLRAKDVSVEKKLTLTSDQPVMSMLIRSSLDIEANTQQTQLTLDALNKIKEQLGRNLNEQSQGLFKKATNNGWDIVGIEEMIKLQRGPEWKKVKDNEELWRKTKLELTFHFVIGSFGNTLDSYKTR